MQETKLKEVAVASNEYFSRKATRYDLVENQLYWQVSDNVLRKLLRDVGSDMPKPCRFLDAGGGTGRWSEFLLTSYPTWTGATVDLSSDMLAESTRKCQELGLGERWVVKQGDLHDVNAVQGGYDLAVCFHNVIGFVAQPELVINNLFTWLRPGGKAVVMFPNSYHAAYFNVKRNALEAAADALRGRGRFAEDMPFIHMFTPTSAAQLCESVGFSVCSSVGFPKFVYPGYEETRLVGDSSVVVSALSNSDSREKIQALEVEYLYEPAAARGNNIVLICQKQ